MTTKDGGKNPVFDRSLSPSCFVRLMLADNAGRLLASVGDPITSGKKSRISRTTPIG